MKLIGSKTSPFVRRIRLLLADEPHEFEAVDVFSPADRQKVTTRNPAGRVPILVDGERVLWDSRIITRYLREKRDQAPPGIDTELVLDVIDGATDTGVILFQLRRFALDETWQNAFSRLQSERLDRLLGHLEESAASSSDDLVVTWLFSLLDWLAFREVTELSRYPRLAAFHAERGSEPRFQATDPRR